MKNNNNIVRQIIPSVLTSEYEFNRFNKNQLEKNPTVECWSISSTPYTFWDESAELLWEKLTTTILRGDVELFCFLSSPYWKKDNKIVRYYGLTKFLQKEFKLSNINFEPEQSIEITGDVLFYGVTKVDSSNFKDISNLLSKLESGLLFTWTGPKSCNFTELVNQLAMTVSTKSKSLTNYLNTPQAINNVLQKGSKAIYPYSWVETGDNHLDIFSL